MRINGTTNARNKTATDLHELGIHVWGFVCLRESCAAKSSTQKITRPTIDHATASSPPLSLPYEILLNNMIKGDFFPHRTPALFCTPADDRIE